MAIVPSRIRFDDVLWKTGDPKVRGKEFQKFTKNVKWCINTNVVLTPAILCQDIMDFPEAIEYVRVKTQEGILYPDLHGFDHGPYAPRSKEVIRDHLKRSIDWFHDHLEVIPVRWVTPHGADTPIMREVAAEHYLILESTSDPVIDQKKLDNRLRETRDLNVFRDKVIMNHWWERGLRLYRIARIIEFQGVSEAITATKEELSATDHKICWNGWM